MHYINIWKHNVEENKTAFLHDLCLIMMLQSSIEKELFLLHNPWIYIYNKNILGVKSLEQYICLHK